YAIASGAVPPKTKARPQKKKDDADKTTKKKPPTDPKGKRVKPTGTVTSSRKKKQPATGLETVSEIALTEAEQLKLVIERSKTQQHSSYAIGSGKSSSDDDDDDDEVRMTKDDQDVSNDQDDDNSDDDERKESDTDGDDFVHPKLTTHDEDIPDDDDSFDLMVYTPPTNDEANDDAAQSGFAKEEDLHTEHLNEEVNINLEGKDAETIETPHIIVQPTLVIDETHVTLTLVNPDGQQKSSSVSSGFISHMLHANLDTCIDSILNDETTSLAQAKNEDFFNKVDENMKKIIKEQVNAQVKKKIDKILPRIEKLVNEQLESESNKSIDRSDIQKNLYKSLVDAYEADKDILDAYGDMVTIKRRRDGANDDQEPSAGPDRGSKRRRARIEPESTSAPKEKTTMTIGKSTEGSKSHQQSASQSAPAEEPMHTAD
ncbi:hypothetical protein Tco_1497852, partial [Tanacetum coccineum]